MTLATQKTGMDLAVLLGIPTKRLVSFSVHVECRQLIKINAHYLCEQPSDESFGSFERKFMLVEDLET